MPKAFQYSAGSVIYFQGDAGDRIFLLQKGSVNLVYQNIEEGRDMHDMAQPGEFFGVKSALGRYPREENAIAMTDSMAMTFSVPEFEHLAMGNTRIIVKMLKVFSTQLRRIHRQVSNLMEKTEPEDPEPGLFSVGEYYLKNRRFSQAKYVFSRYLTYYPSGRQAVQAAKNLETAENFLSRYGAAAGNAERNAPAKKAPSPPPPSGEEAQQGVAKAYYEAVSFITQQKYQQAYMSLRKIIDTGEDGEFVAKSSFELGRCFFLMGKYDECIQSYTMMITKYPKHPDLGDALYYMGQSYEKQGLPDQAVSFYKKIMTLVTDPDNSAHIRAKRALKALEEA
ncbi:MAG: cyclic nucleotide-binding domain-containing protein [Treponema sp.]|jgi:TolA-binding protein|nr:cyclic nucleotide-binding domain-containing protein [Treponema sp.]